MFQFIYWLKLLAVILITNSHYGSVWPTSSLAVGGQLGNCLYFFISGFCLYYAKESFVRWYSKRIVRIYPSLWIATGIGVLLGYHESGNLSAIMSLFIYPTFYHFVASIMVLYIFYYLYRKYQNGLKLNTVYTIGMVCIIFLIVYFIRFDKVYYHIDNVEEHWVRYLYFVCMLAGAWCREHYDDLSVSLTILDYVIVIVLSLVYFIAKIGFSKISILAPYQIIMPIVIFWYIFFIAILFIKLEKNGKFSKFSLSIHNFVRSISSLTMEIYLGQYLILWLCSGLVFPSNIVIISLGILIYAYIIHSVSSVVQRFLIERISEVRK